jgi:hypothetical protein
VLLKNDLALVQVVLLLSAYACFAVFAGFAICGALLSFTLREQLRYANNFQISGSALD